MSDDRFVTLDELALVSEAFDAIPDGADRRAALAAVEQYMREHESREEVTQFAKSLISIVVRACLKGS